MAVLDLLLARAWRANVKQEPSNSTLSRSKWPDFLFTIAVRFVCGAVLGALASILICAPISRYAIRRPLLLWVVGDEAHPWRPYYWFGAWSLGGAIVAMLTTPKWQTPWYRRDSETLNLWEESEAYGQDGDKTGAKIPNLKKLVTIKTVDERGEQHEYSSMAEVPPEIRSEIEALETEAIREKGNELSVTETSQAGDVITSRSIYRKNVSVYKIVDESGVERIYRSVDEMPPEIRSAIAQAEEKLK